MARLKFSLESINDDQKTMNSEQVNLKIIDRKENPDYDSSFFSNVVVLLKKTLLHFVLQGIVLIWISVWKVEQLPMTRYRLLLKLMQVHQPRMVG